MDPRGASPLVDDPRGELERLQEAGGTQFEHLNRAAEYTTTQLRERSEAFASGGLARDMTVVVFGSWARNELTDGSDDDWAVLVGREFADYDRDVVHAMALAQQHLGADEKEPGSQQVFGVPFDIDGLVDHIGLDDDTNRNLTRRMLLLLESRELAGDIHAECWGKVLERYLLFGIKNNRPPRFLLNDLVRYWRTICVDFEGKHRDTGGEDPKWVTRNAKLRTSRKLLFAGGLVPILLCHLRDGEQRLPHAETARCGSASRSPASSGCWSKRRTGASSPGSRATAWTTRCCGSGCAAGSASIPRSPPPNSGAA